MDVKLPSNLDYKTTLDFINCIHNLENSDKYYFDFDDLNWTPPFSLVAISCAIRQFRAQKADSEFFAVNHERHSYQAHMGFFNAFGLDYGNKPGEASGNSRYLPISIIKSDELFTKDNITKPIGEIIEIKSNQLSKLLTQEETGNLVDTLTYALREIIRNVFEHSQSDQLEYCAQYWPSRNKVEIAIIDTGIGILKSISENSQLKIGSNLDALKTSLLPGVSGKIYQDNVENYDDPWINTGYGLFILNRLCRLGGEFLICSGTDAICYQNDDKTEISTNFQGTAIGMEIDLSKIDSLSDTIDDILKQGKEIIKDLGGNANISASKASSMLKSDFKK